MISALPDLAAWQALDRQVRAWWDGDVHTATPADVRADEAGTLLPLPCPYVTPGGSEAAFPEMYGWDTHFIDLGLLAHGRSDLVRGHAENMLWQIERYGKVLNGNRRYYLTRSQTPLHPVSLRLLHEHEPDLALLDRAFPLLEREYRDYWCGPGHATGLGLSTNRDSGDPHHRPELAAEAETGLDFTPIFGGDVRRCAPLITNCALVRYADTLAWLAGELGEADTARHWEEEARTRAGRIRDLCWDDEQGFFFEVRDAGERLPYWSLCAYWTLWARVATPGQAARLVSHLPRFERPGGLSFTDQAYPSPHPEYESLQWNSPSGWAPMQLIVAEGLERYGYHAEARRLSAAFLGLMMGEYSRSGKLWERYDVDACTLPRQHERYALPAFHGWTSAAVAALGRRVFAPSAQLEGSR